MRPVLRFLLPVALAAGLVVPTSAAVAAPAEVVRTYGDFFIFTRCDPNVEITKGTSLYQVVSKQNNDGTWTQRFHGIIKATGELGNTWISNSTFVITTDGIDFVLDYHSVMIGHGSLPNELMKGHFSTSPYEESLSIECRG
jgi:hypothetical protein